jgi:hypothetical protein
MTNYRDMTDWKFAQREPEEELAKVSFFSMKKQQDGQSIEFGITVREFVTPKDPCMLFFAEADKQTNQRTAPYTPSGWGTTLLEALSDCMEGIRRFPYEPEAEASYRQSNTAITGK